MGRTVAETIRGLIQDLIDSGQGITIGQCLTAVGWVQNTIPAREFGNYELPMTDVAGAGIAVGVALTGKRPIFVIRFQSFLWLNASPIVNYAAKSKEMFGIACPILVRAIATERDGSGPIHTNCFHSMFMHMPGIQVTAPMTPLEYEKIWSSYLNDDNPMLVSEHRRSYKNTSELPDVIVQDADVTLFAISAARFTALEALEVLGKKGIRTNLINVVWLKPFNLESYMIEALEKSGCGIVIDSAYEICGASQSIAYDLMIATGKPVQALGQFDRSPGVAEHLENGTPTAERIVEAVERITKQLWRHPHKSLTDSHRLSLT